MFDFDHVFDDEAAASAPVVEEPAVETAPALETPAAPAAPVAETPAAPSAPAAPAAADEEFKGAPPGYVPYGALKEERLKRQTLEDVVRGKNPTPPAASQPSASEVIPDIYSPEYPAYIQNQLEMTNINSALNLSEARATVKYGPAVVKDLQDWASSQGEYFFQSILKSPDAYEAAKVEYDRAKAAEAYSAIDQTQLAAFKQWQADQTAAAEAAKAAAATPNTPTAATPPAVVAPSVHAAQKAQEGLPKPVSSGTIATNPSAGGAKVGEVAVAPGNAFDATFS